MKLKLNVPSLFLLLSLICLFDRSSSIDPPVGKSKLKILGVFGHLGKSHFDVFRPLLEELARRGHDLTVISYFPRSAKSKQDEPLPTYKDISLLSSDLALFRDVVDLKQITHPVYQLFEELYLLHYMAGIACEATWNHTNIRSFYQRKESFDLILTESFNSRCFYGLIHWIDAPRVELSSHQLMPWIFDEFGFDPEAGHMPGLFSFVPRPMRFLDRFTNALSIKVSSVLSATMFRWRDERIMRKYIGEEAPTLEPMVRNVSLMLVNTHYTIHGARSLPPNIIEIGGLHIPQKNKELPPDVKKFLDDAKDGVLYFNLGSMVKMSSVPEDKLNVLLNVFERFDKKILWKWEADLPRKMNNVMVKKWLPQFDILNHPNVKCYFGHGGLLGLSEGVHAGVPMVLMPLYGDQHHNSIAAQARGVAVVLEYTELNEENLRAALDQIFNNTKYQENAKRLSKAYRDRIATPLETAVWWTEYIGRGNGVPYIRSEASTLSWCVRNLVDVITVFIVIAFLSLYGTYRAARYLLSRRKNRRQEDARGSSKKNN